MYNEKVDVHNMYMVEANTVYLCSLMTCVYGWDNLLGIENEISLVST